MANCNHTNQEVKSSKTLHNANGFEKATKSTISILGTAPTLEQWINLGLCRPLRPKDSPSIEWPKELSTKTYARRSTAVKTDGLGKFKWKFDKTLGRAFEVEKNQKGEDSEFRAERNKFVPAAADLRLLTATRSATTPATKELQPHSEKANRKSKMFNPEIDELLHHNLDPFAPMGGGCGIIDSLQYANLPPIYHHHQPPLPPVPAILAILALSATQLQHLQSALPSVANFHNAHQQPPSHSHSHEVYHLTPHVPASQLRAFAPSSTQFPPLNQQPISANPIHLSSQQWPWDTIRVKPKLIPLSQEALYFKCQPLP